MGQRTHTDWVGLGESMVVNRRSIMIDVLGRKRWTDRLHLFAYEVVYCSISMAVQARFRPQRMSRSALLIWGKLRAFIDVYKRQILARRLSGFRSFGPNFS